MTKVSPCTPNNSPSQATHRLLGGRLALSPSLRRISFAPHKYPKRASTIDFLGESPCPGGAGTKLTGPMPKPEPAADKKRAAAAIAMPKVFGRGNWRRFKFNRIVLQSVSARTVSFIEFCVRNFDSWDRANKDWYQCFSMCIGQSKNCQHLNGRLEAVTRLGNNLKACWGKLFAKSFPQHPLQKLPNIATTFSSRQTAGADERKTASLPKIEPQPVPLERQWLQIIGVFGVGSGGALFVRPPRSLFPKLVGFATTSKFR